MTLGVSLGIYIIFLAIYWFFVYSILWHLKEYILPVDQSKNVVKLFLIVVVILNFLSIIFFFKLPFVS